MAIGPAFALVNTGNLWAFLLTQALVFGIAMPPAADVTSSLYSMAFDSDVDYSGMSISFTLTHLVGSAWAPPTIAPTLGNSTNSSNSNVATA
ncbi:hypothetical protein [Nocardia carnea]|uniref:hypothetical protein n=1 Tax=Nocardia carnea TaxID=37328 RepID=UPI00245456B9|nr:hypothetical protein [Nocardia carnea]